MEVCIRSLAAAMLTSGLHDPYEILLLQTSMHVLPLTRSRTRHTAVVGSKLLQTASGSDRSCFCVLAAWIALTRNHVTRGESDRRNGQQLVPLSPMCIDDIAVKTLFLLSSTSSIPWPSYMYQDDTHWQLLFDMAIL